MKTMGIQNLPDYKYFVKWDSRDLINKPFFLFSDSRRHNFLTLPMMIPGKVYFLTLLRYIARHFKSVDSLSTSY